MHYETLETRNPAACLGFEAINHGSHFAQPGDVQTFAIISAEGRCKPEKELTVDFGNGQTWNIGAAQTLSRSSDIFFRPTYVEPGLYEITVDGQRAGTVEIGLIRGDANRDGEVNDLDKAWFAEPYSDISGDGRVSAIDLETMRAVHDVSPGDANADGVFDSGDLVSLFELGTYGERAHGWSEGDFNNDGRFDSADLVFAMESGYAG